MATGDLNQVTPVHVSTEELKPKESAEVIPFPEQPEESENPIDQLVAVIESFSHIREAHNLRRELINKGLARKGAKGKGFAAIDGVEGSERLVTALKEAFKRFHQVSVEKAEERKINSLLEDIKRQKTPNDIRDLSIAARDKGYIERAYDRQTRDWEVSAIEGKEGSDKVAKAIMAKKAEIEATNKRASVADLLRKYSK